MMQVHEFFGKYANVPIADRMTVIDFHTLGPMTLNDIYGYIKRTEEQMRPIRIEQDRLIRACEKFILEHQA